MTSRNHELLIRTALQKSPRQLVGIIDRKLRNRIVPQLPVDFDARYERKIPSDLGLNLHPHSIDLRDLRYVLSDEELAARRRRALDFLDESITFLNRTRKIKNSADICPDDPLLKKLPRLWFLKLSGFEPLEWVTTGFETPDTSPLRDNRLQTWIEQFAEKHPIANRNGYLRGAWTPYCVSNRIINLSRYAAWRGHASERVRNFLFKNLLFLDNHIENDIGGNHLIENGAALIAGGLAFDEDGERFVEKGVGILQTAVEEQFLDDGYHYERTPMYHLAVTERLIFSLKLLELGGFQASRLFKTRVADACGFIKYLTGPDGEIALLNDSVLGEAIPAEACIKYGRDIGARNIVHPETDASGLVWFETDDASLLADFGASGPENLLAHTHNDPFTICVWSDSTPVIADTGTFDYKPGQRRQYSRSVRAHNTTHPDGKEPVEFGGRFLMPQQLSPEVRFDQDTGILCGLYTAPDTKYEHRRVIVDGSDWWLVWDTIEDLDVVSRLHSVPGVEIKAETKAEFLSDEDVLLHVEPLGNVEISSEMTPYYPQFGVEKHRESLVLNSTNGNVGYLISKQTIDSVSIDCENGELRDISVDGERFNMSEVLS